MEDDVRTGVGGREEEGGRREEGRGGEEGRSKEEGGGGKEEGRGEREDGGKWEEGGRHMSAEESKPFGGEPLKMALRPLRSPFFGPKVSSV